jgi:AAA domain (dynein-related subfamily)
MPKIWRVSHSIIKDKDHLKLIEHNLLAIGFLPQLKKGNTRERDKFSNIDEGDYFYLVRGGYIVLFGKFGPKIDPPLTVKDNCVILNEEEISLSDLAGWLCREIIKIKDNISFSNDKIICADNVKKLKYMPSGQSTVFEVPDNALSQFQTDVLLPVFELNLEDLKITMPSKSNLNDVSSSLPKKSKVSSLNQILFGPPGTGKTYNTVNKAIAIANPSFKEKDTTRKQIKTEFDELINSGQVVFTTFHQSMSYEDFIEGIKPLKPVVGDTFVKYEVQPGIFKRICDNAAKDKDKNFVLIIDEINRGNVSQIFGELITLIEDDKRIGKDEALMVTLTYSKEEFGVPSNLYIIGTMNTADRSVEALDAALRRRFSFEEMPPNTALIGDVGSLKETGGILDLETLGNINLPELLDVINKRIEKLLDKDHQIGHSYFMSVASLDDLKQKFQNNIIPLLQEYFFGDYGKIGLVLGKGFVSKDDSNKNNFAAFSDTDADEFSERPIFKIKPLTSDEAFIEAINSLLNKNTDGE